MRRAGALSPSANVLIPRTRYGVAREMKPVPLIFPSKIGERWVIALNPAGVFEDEKLYGIFPAEGVSELVLAALLNWTWAVLRRDNLSADDRRSSHRRHSCIRWRRTGTIQT
jgi:hypothetical protein